MNLSLVVVCWIAISSLFGIFFGYSSLGLTTSTAIVALALGLVLAGIPLFLRRSSLRFGISIPNSHQYIAVAISIFFLVFAAWEFTRVIFVTNDEIRVSSPNNLGDICLHLAQINYLASSPHYWPENPIFAFDKLRYPIGVNVFNAEWKLVGIEPNLGIILGRLGRFPADSPDPFHFQRFVRGGCLSLQWRTSRFSFFPNFRSEGLSG